MAAGEYVSVSSQADTEAADVDHETKELAEQPEFELQELTNIYRVRPVEAALTSARAFAVGAALPLLAAALLFLMLLGAVGARAGGLPVGRGVLHVAFWGVLAMAATYAISSLFGTSVA